MKTRSLRDLILKFVQRNNKQARKSVVTIYLARNGVDSECIFRMERSLDESVYIAKMIPTVQSTRLKI